MPTSISTASSGYKSSYTGTSTRSYDSMSLDENTSLVLRCRNMIFNLMYFLNKEVHKQIPSPIRSALFIVELIQLLTLVIDPALVYWGVEGTAFGQAMRYLTYIRTIRLPYSSQVVFLWIIIAYAIIVLGLSVELAFSLTNGEGADSRRLRLLCFLSMGVLPVLYIYFIDTLLAFLVCLRDTAGNEISGRFLSEGIQCGNVAHYVFRGFSMGAILVLAPIMGISSLLVYQPHRSSSKQGKNTIRDLINGRIMFLFAITKTLLVCYLEISPLITDTGLQGGLYSWLGMITTGILFIYCVYYLPFLHKFGNLIFSMFMAASFFGFLCGFSVGNVDNASGTSGLIVFLAAFIPISALAGAAVYFLRIRPLYNWKYDHLYQFKRAFEVEISTRSAQQSAVVNEDHIINTFTLGIEQYRDDGYLQATYAMFLLEKKSDFHLLTITIERARNTVLPIDFKFLIFYIERERINSALAMDGGAEEIHKKLQAVKKHSKRARMYIKTFWDVLLKEEDLESLPEIVASVELEEKRASTILLKLREKFPRNVTILRHYAGFLEKVKNDPEAAHAALRAADEIEEEKAIRHRNKAAKKAAAKKQQQQKQKQQQDKKKKVEQVKPPTPLNKSSGETTPNSVQVRFKVNSTHSLPNTVNNDVVETEDLIAGVLGIDRETEQSYYNVDDNNNNNNDDNIHNRNNIVLMSPKSPMSRSTDKVLPPPPTTEYNDNNDYDNDYSAYNNNNDKSANKKKHKGGRRNSDHVVSIFSDDRDDDEHTDHSSVSDSDKASNITGSSYSFEQLKSMKRSDLLRYRKYRYLTENSRSRALSKLKVAINFTLLILFIDVVVVFITSQVMMTTFNGSVNSLTNAANANYLTHDAALSVQNLRAFVLLRQNDTALQLRNTMSTRMSYLTNVIHGLYKEESGYKPLEEGWSIPQYSVLHWDTTTKTNTPKIRSMWDAISEFVWRVEQVAQLDDSKMRYLAESVAMHFVLDNGPTEIYRALTDLVNLYMQKNTSVSQALTILCAVLICVSFASLALLVLFLSRPATKEIRVERSEMLRLFLAIPKSSVSAVSKRMSTQEEEDHEHSNAEEIMDVTHSELREEYYQYSSTSSGQVPILKSFVRRYLSSMVLIFLGCLGICLIAILTSQTVAGRVAEIRAITQERVLVTRVQGALLNMRIARLDQTNIEPLKKIVFEDTANIVNLDYALRFGDKSQKLPGGFSRDEFLMKTYYGGDCPTMSKYDITCDGLASAFQIYVENALSVAKLNSSQILYNNSQADICNTLNDNYINNWLRQTRDYFQSEAIAEVNSSNVAIIVLFILLLPSLLLVNFTLRPILERIKDENTRTVKMLLILPFDVIDSVHPIRDFLNTGLLNTDGGKGKKNKSGLSLYGSSADELMQTIFLGNQEPIIVTSVAGEIDVFNPQAEQLFGVVKQEVFGKNFTSLLCADDVQKYNNALLAVKNAAFSAESPKEIIEVTGVNQASNHSVNTKGHNITAPLIHLQVCLSYAKVSGKVFVINYVRDLTLVKTMQKQAKAQNDSFIFEKKKMTDLMYNVFPASVAEQLMKESDSGKEKTLIAEEYKEVTVLFADLVGFTSMCSRLEPALLLLILNGIFSKWDALVEKYGLQKIKTIGDCYMVAGGVPDRTIDHAQKMLDFATEMKEALDEYNVTSDLLLSRGITLNMRVGINTGPVVAGIIGETRMCFDLWGDAVNVASRMESTSVEGRIQVSHSTFTHVKDNYEFEERTAEVKGKGVMLTYLLVGKRFYRSPSGTLLDLRFMKHSMGDARRNSGDDVLVRGTSINVANTARRNSVDDVLMRGTSVNIVNNRRSSVDDTALMQRGNSSVSININDVSSGGGEPSSLNSSMKASTSNNSVAYLKVESSPMVNSSSSAAAIAAALNNTTKISNLKKSM